MLDCHLMFDRTRSSGLRGCLSGFGFVHYGCETSFRWGGAIGCGGWSDGRRSSSRYAGLRKDVGSGVIAVELAGCCRDGAEAALVGAGRGDATSCVEVIRAAFGRGAESGSSDRRLTPAAELLGMSFVVTLVSFGGSGGSRAGCAGFEVDVEVAGAACFGPPMEERMELNDCSVWSQPTYFDMESRRW